MLKADILTAKLLIFSILMYSIAADAHFFQFNLVLQYPGVVRVHKLKTLSFAVQ